MSMYLLNKNLVAFIIAVLLCIQVNAQSERDSVKTTPRPQTVNKLYRPQLEMGFGVLSYYGDVGNLNGISTSHELNWGYHIALANPISKSFDVNLFAMYGKMSAGERLLNEDVNFESKIKMGSVSLVYNFNALLPPNRSISPYLSLGISTYEFNSKSDLRDANGNEYHYWDDGTVRDMPQSDLNAGGAQMLERDYNYETDLRYNSENQATYSTRAFTVPVGAGVHLKLTDAFMMRMGAEFHFGLSDNIDNISDNSEFEGGKDGNDNFLYSSVGISYNLHHRKNQKILAELGTGNAIALEEGDQDMDGVADIYDVCANTPEGVAVTEYGCPWDSDNDGVPDYIDEEKSPKGAIVNLKGVTVTDEENAAIYDRYINGAGHSNYTKSTTYTADIKRNERSRRTSNGYRVVITNANNLQNEDIAKLLSIQAIKSEETAEGSTYYLGSFQTLEEAVQNQALLDEFETKLVSRKNELTVDVTLEEIAGISDDLESLIFNADQVVFRVQIGAYRYRLSKKVFTEVPSLIVMEGNDGLSRYVSGSFTNIKDAAEHKVDLLLKGFEGAFVTAYKGGKRITLKEAGATVTSAEDITTSKESGKIDKSLVKYTIQLESIQGRIPAEVLNKFMSLGGVRPVRGNNGTTKYVYGSFQDMDSANEAIQEITDKGFDKAIIVGDFNGQIIDAKEAAKIKNN